MEKACYSNTFTSDAFLFIAVEIIAMSGAIGEKKKVMHISEFQMALKLYYFKKILFFVQRTFILYMQTEILH